MRYQEVILVEPEDDEEFLKIANAFPLARRLIFKPYGKFAISLKDVKMKAKFYQLVKESPSRLERPGGHLLYFGTNGGDRTVNQEDCAIAKVSEKYSDEFINKKDIYFFLGTTKRFHNVAPNPFLIIGVFYPPKQPEPKESLFTL